MNDRGVLSFTGLAGLGAALALLACPSQREAPPQQPPPRPEALTVATLIDLADETRAALDDWQADHPQTKLELIVLAPGDFMPAMTPRLASGQGLPDLMLVDAQFLGRLGAAGALEDLSRAPHDAGPLGDRFPPSMAAQGRLGGAQVGVPLDVAPLLAFYRKDVLDRAGVTEADLSGSWEGFVSACAKVKTATGAYCVSRYGELADAVLRSGLKDGQSPYFSAADEPLPDGEAVLRAMRLASTAHAAGIDAAVILGTPPWTELMKADRMAVQLGGPTMVHRLDRLVHETGGGWRAAPLPGSAAVSAGSAFCALPARGARKELAWDAFRRACLSRKAGLAAYRAAGAVPALLEAAHDPAVDQPVPFLGNQVIGPMVRAAAARLPAVPTHRMDALAADAFALELDRVVQSGKDPEQALADARAEIARRLRR